MFVVGCGFGGPVVGFDNELLLFWYGVKILMFLR